MAQKTIWESDKKNTHTRKHNTQESQGVSPFPAGDHKAARNRQDSITKTNMIINNKEDPQKKHLERSAKIEKRKNKKYHFEI